MAQDDQPTGDPGSPQDRICPDQSAVPACGASMAGMAAMRETFM